MNDPRAIKFANDYVRPVSERLRALNAILGAALTEWNANSNEIALLFATGTDVLVDGRAGDGVRQLTSAEIEQIIGVITAVSAAINNQIVGVACVTPFTAS